MWSIAEAKLLGGRSKTPKVCFYLYFFQRYHHAGLCLWALCWFASHLRKLSEVRPSQGTEDFHLDSMEATFRQSDQVAERLRGCRRAEAEAELFSV